MIVVGRAYNRNYWSLGVNYRFKTPFENFSIVFVLTKTVGFHKQLRIFFSWRPRKEW